MSGTDGADSDCEVAAARGIDGGQRRSGHQLMLPAGRRHRYSCDVDDVDGTRQPKRSDGGSRCMPSLIS